jgi:Mg-chelatase subunit ChlD
MPNDPSRPQRPSWRNTGQASAARPKHAWQRGSDDQTVAGKAGWSLRSKFLLLGSAFLALLTIIVVMLYLIRPTKDPRIEMLVANSPDLRLPANPYARHAAAGWHLEGTPITWNADGNPLQDLLSRCDGSLGSRPVPKVILFLGAPGGADAQGPYWIPNGADPRERSQMLRLDQLLDDLGKLPKKTSKLVLVDSTQTMAHWPLGLLHNEFIRKLKEREEDIKKVPNLVLLCASDVGQRSWVSEEWRQSVFMHFVIEGMSGATTHGGAVYASDLYKYVRDRVVRWSVHNRAAYQEPILLGGDGRAESMELVRPRGGESGPPAELKSLDGLLKKWSDCDRLARRSPPPWQTAPTLWRQYLDTLLRYEQLVRADAEEAAHEQLVENLKNLIEAEKAKTLSAPWTLPGLAAQGSELPEAEEKELVAKFEVLWRDYDAAKEKGREQIEDLARAQSADPLARRNRLFALLLDRAIAAPDGGLVTACDLLKAIHQMGKPLPAEALFMLQLGNNRHGVGDPVVARALRLRKLAEQAALGFAGDGSDRLPAYSEQVRPWIQEFVNKGDAYRQPGEDLLFASDEKSWQTAEKMLKDAEDQYNSARQTALTIREALAARDELMAGLPYYSHWQAALRPTDPGPDRLAELESLWEKVHELDDELAKSPQPAKVEPIGKLARGAREKYATLQKDFKSHCQRLTEDKSLQSTWHAIEAALAVPFIETKLREELLSQSRNIARQLQEKAKDADAGNKDVEKKREEETALVLAKRQGTMALAVFDRPWLEKQGYNYDQLNKYLHQPDIATNFMEAADKLGQLWSALTSQVSRDTEAGLTKPTVALSTESLQTAVRSARRLDGAGAMYLSVDPVAALRRLQWHDWLCWQAQRTLGDHWFYEDGKTPYYPEAGLAYVGDASHLASADLDKSSPDKKQRESIAAQLAANFDPVRKCVAKWRRGADFADPPATLDITDERTVEWAYQITVPEGASAGYVVYQGKAGNWLDQQAQKKSPVWKATPELGGTTRVHDAPFPLIPKDNPRHPINPDRSSHDFVAFFRGQKVPVKTDVRLHRVPDLVSHHRRMPLGAIAVQADAGLFRAFHLKNAELVIVLDASGSMASLKEGKSRLDRARESLKTVLDQLPQGVKVSLWVFSHEGAKAPERLWALEPWDSTKLAAKMAKLNQIKPWGETPLLNSMRTAAKQDFGAGRTSKTLVVITDGGDSDVDPDSIPNILENEFTKQGIRVRAIGFELEFPPTAQGKREEQGAKKFKEYLDKVNGFFPAKDARELVDRLRRSMFQMDFQLASAKFDQVVEREGPLSQPGENLQWLSDVRPGLYNLQVRFLGQRLSAEERMLHLGPGDYMVVNVRPSDKGQGLVLQRDLFTEPLTPRLEKPLKVEPSPNNEWLVAIHENRARDDGTLELMATLEKSVNREPPPDGTLRHFKPRLVLFEVTRGGNNKPLPLHFGTLPGYRAPAYTLDVREWGGRSDGDKTLVDVWWTESDVPNDINHPYARILQYGKDDGFILGNNFRKVHAKVSPGQWTDDVVLDSVTIEELDVETRSDSHVTQRESCLVVRLHFPKGKPFVVRVPDPAAQGDQSHLQFEHRLYYAAQKYTGVFWGWTAADLRAGLKNLQLELISLEGLKDKDAGANHVRFELGAPQPTSQRPQKDCMTRFAEN